MSEADDELPADLVKAQTNGRTSLSYVDRLNERLATLSRALAGPAAVSFEPVLTLSHATSVHALALPPGGHHLFSGGQDGFIRRYSIYESLNGIDSARNLVMKHAGADSGVLVGYWENAETLEGDQSLKWGPRSISSLASGRGLGSPVFSMIVQSQEIFGISGTQNGDMNLWTIRHDEGQIRHVFKASAEGQKGHAKSSAVSALCFAPDERSFYSGGWDSRLLHWDLNTGQAIRTFTDRDQDFATEGLRSNQVSSISLHPLAPAPALPTYPPLKPLSPTASRMEVDKSTTIDVDADGSPAAEYDPLFDGNNSGGEDEALAQPVTSTEPLPDFDDQSLPALSQDLVLVSSISGQVLLYDRRADGNAARRLPLEQGTAPWAMRACWSAAGDSVFVGRREATIDIYDIKAGKRRKIHLPPQSGPVSDIIALPGGRHILAASFDSLRIYDLEHRGKGVPYQVVPDYYGSTVSRLAYDPSQRVFAAALGHRGWAEPRATDTDGVMLYAAR